MEKLIENLLCNNNKKLISVEFSNNGNAERYDGRSLQEFRKINITQDSCSEDSSVTTTIGSTKIKCESNVRIVNEEPELRK